MKIILIILTVLGAFQAQAADHDHILKCEERSFAGVWLYLDSANLSETSQHFQVAGATIFYHYSGINSMACDNGFYRKDGADTLNCAGYYYKSELSSVKFVPEDGKVFVEWQTSKPYGEIKFKTECELVTL